MEPLAHWMLVAIEILMGEAKGMTEYNRDWLCCIILGLLTTYYLHKKISEQDKKIARGEKVNKTIGNLQAIFPMILAALLCFRFHGINYLNLIGFFTGEALYEAISATSQKRQRTTLGTPSSKLLLRPSHKNAGRMSKISQVLLRGGSRPERSHTLLRPIDSNEKDVFTLHEICEARLQNIHPEKQD
ncbi:MAG TPA: hypothetical protein VKV29_05435 [Chthonomonas sp.]|uniref:hypothetical protein n=1 Tax=Chthonomonas sp. TaxID=2282153 RepID=UPI002B4B3C48|nr:hypothetical protein [Chthonomonas sp.]HLH79710.1 hypothetical protein [Chthonomonas sp.]